MYTEILYAILTATVLGSILFKSLAKRKVRHSFVTYGPTHKPALSVISTYNPQTIGEMFYKRVQIKPTAPAFYEKKANGSQEGKGGEEGKWECTTWGSFFEQASMVASYLVNVLHLSRGSKVCILGPTKSKWVIADMGVQLAGCVSVGLYPHQTPEQYKFIISHCEADVVFVDGEKELDRILIAVHDLHHVKSIIVWDELATNGAYPPKVKGWSATTHIGKLDEEVLADRIALHEPGEISVLVYTSGTTGPPKAVMLSHRNILALGKGLVVQGQFYEDDLSFNFLPLAHVAEKFVGFYTRIDKGIVNCFASSVAQVIPELQEVCPTLFGSVPRIFEKAYAKISSDIAKKPLVVQMLFHWATTVATERTRLHCNDKHVNTSLKLKYWIAYKIFSPVRAAFGGRVTQMAVGAAPIDMKILEFFWGCGVPIYELYGMTELTAISHVNSQLHIKLGTVGKIVDGAECKIAEDGELLVRAPFVFEGYFKNPAATAEAKDKEGWLHTGDIGRLDKDGFLTITDRKKHLIITSGGKNLSPANIENAIKNQDPIISQVHSHGDRRPYVVALIAPSPLDTLEWGVSRQLVQFDVFKTLEKELLANPFMRSERLNTETAKVTGQSAFIERVRAAVASGNQKLSQVEQIKKFFILDRDFSQEHGELTPTMKMRRREIEHFYATTFEHMYTPSFGFDVEKLK